MNKEYSYYDLILNPIITEKAADDRMKNNKYIFNISLNANKQQVKEAVEHLFKVNVLSVNTQSVKGKPKRLGRFSGYTSKKKKAIVTLKEGERIKIMEGP